MVISFLFQSLHLFHGPMEDSSSIPYYWLAQLGSPLSHGSFDEQHRTQCKPPSATDICPKSKESSKLSLDNISLPAGGEGKSKEEIKTPEPEEEEKWEDASENRASFDEGSSESFGSLDEEEAEEEEEVRSTPSTVLQKELDGGHMDDSAKYKQEFHSLPKQLVPSEITHCLFQLEEECRGVEQESESVKWKMELIHCSVQALQETLRILLTRLVEAQSFEKHGGPKAHHFCPIHSPIQSQHEPPNPCGPNTHTSGAKPVPNLILNQPHHQIPHPHCKALHAIARRPSETCLTHPTNTGGTSAPMELPSCAQRRRERAMAFHAITELRMEVERLRVVREQEKQEQREVLQFLKEFQQQMMNLLKQRQRDEEHEEEDRMEESVSAKLDLLKQQTRHITEMAQRAVSVFDQVGVQLEGLGAVGSLVRSASTNMSTATWAREGATNRPLRCQRCNTETEDDPKEEL
ncbi:uncharacterized protein LOC115816166 [Chanos chanos]|uniref:Uncharacterized protein LOC115816166 n=1 Tax=Chanos chanos TaxID=29144 RepID=A0A6J2VPW6_CHACN|nr:uncharacterized protein LOC115816166 [Chanos chanos]